MNAAAGCGNRTARKLFVRKTTPRSFGTLRTVSYSVTNIIYLFSLICNSFCEKISVFTKYGNFFCFASSYT